MRLQVITLFPEMITSACSYGVVGQAWRENKLEIQTINPRDFTEDVHHAVDDRPFGGGDGMVMIPSPLEQAMGAAQARVSEARSGKTSRVRKIYLSARGRPFGDKVARELAQEEELILLCGRYGGVDQRVIEALFDEELSIGDYILSGGEIAALTVIDAVGRLLPGVLGNERSPHEESFSQGLLEYPQFTRPRSWRDWDVPAVLLGGNHAQIEEWRLGISLALTAERRPDLLRARGVTALDVRRAERALNVLSPAEKRSCGIRAAEDALAALEAALELGVK